MSIGRRNEGIDVLRGVSIVLVLLHHFNIAYPLAGTALGAALRVVARNGNYGVTIFFAVSGFLITSNSLRRWPGLAGVRPSAFYRLRIARIVPCLALLLALTGVLGAAGMGLFQSRIPGTHAAVSPMLVYGAAIGFWMNVLVVHLGWVNYPLGVLWSLSVEEVFYAAFPLVCRALRDVRKVAWFWLAVAAVGPAYRATHQGADEAYLYGYFGAFDGIAIGCLTALLRERGRLVVPGWARLGAGLGMAALYLCAPIAVTNVWGVSVMALGAALLLLAADGRGESRARWSGGAAWLGRLSYELYLFHLAVLALMREVVPTAVAPGSSRLALLAVFLLISASVAAGIGRFYAGPLNAAMRPAR